MESKVNHPGNILNHRLEDDNDDNDDLRTKKGQSIGSVNNICTSWNKATRKVWKLPQTAHTCFLEALNGLLHTLDQIVKRFIRFYNWLVSNDNSIVSFIARLSVSNRMSYLMRNILYIKWKYDVDITTNNIQQCIKYVYGTGQDNAQILSYVYMIQELIATQRFQNNSEHM